MIGHCPSSVFSSLVITHTGESLVDSSGAFARLDVLAPSTAPEVFCSPRLNQNSSSSDSDSVLESESYFFSSLVENSMKVMLR